MWILGLWAAGVRPVSIYDISVTRGADRVYASMESLPSSDVSSF